MEIHRNQKQQHRQFIDTSTSESTASGVEDTHGSAVRSAPTASMSRTKRKAHPSFFERLDAAARTFLGPADRTDGNTPVVHLHDAAEDTSDETLRSVDIYTDSFGHHYGQRQQPLKRRAL